MLPIQGLVSALYSIFGVVPCSSLTYNFIIGSFAAAFFAAQTSANLFLALDRLIDTIFPKFAKFLFSNGRPWLWTMASSAFGLYYFIWVKPPFFSPTNGNWFMNPYQDFTNISVNIEAYVDPIITYYDAVLTFGFPIIYVIFVVSFLRKHRKNYGNRGITIQTTTVTFISKQNVVLFQKVQPKNICATSNTNFTKIIFVQVAAVNGINVATFVLFALMQNLPMSKPLIVVGFYCNYLMFGFPPIIYLLVNRTIRSECRKISIKIIKTLWH